MKKRMAAGSVKRWVLIGLGVVLLGLAPSGFRWCYVTWQIRAARQALSDGQPALAATLLRKAGRLQSGRAETLFLLGRALRRSGELDEALSCLDQALEAGWSADDVRLQRQLMLVQTGAFAQAGDFLNDALIRGASDDMAEEIYEARARGFYSSFRLGDALLCIDFWLQWRPHARQARIWRAEIYERTERWRDAVADYRAIVEHDTGDVEARTRLADALLPLNDTRAALEEYEKCLASRPNDAAALLGRCKCLRRLGELTDVVPRLSALLDRDLTQRQRGEVLHELGEISLYNQEYEKAVEYLTQARQIDPINALVHQPLTTAYSRLGMTELAEREKRRGEQSVERSNRLAEITRQVIIDPRDPELRYEAGMILIAEGFKKEGAAWLKTAVECAPAHQKSHAALSEYYEGTGDLEGARHHRKLAGKVGNEERADVDQDRK